MGLFGALVTRQTGPRLRRAARQHSDGARLAVRTRCILVADLVAIEPDGTHETVLSGVDDRVARDLYQELTGRPWTRAEAS
jgi:hypothetical protein